MNPRFLLMLWVLFGFISQTPSFFAAALDREMRLTNTLNLAIARAISIASREHSKSTRPN